MSDPVDPADRNHINRLIARLQEAGRRSRPPATPSTTLPPPNRADYYDPFAQPNPAPYPAPPANWYPQAAPPPVSLPFGSGPWGNPWGHANLPPFPHAPLQNTNLPHLSPLATVQPLAGLSAAPPVVHSEVGPHVLSPHTQNGHLHSDGTFPTTFPRTTNELQLNLNPQDEYPSPHSVKEEKVSPVPAPAILVNSKPAESSDNDEYFGGDDAWIDTAIAEMKEVNGQEVAPTVQPPQPAPAQHLSPPPAVQNLVPAADPHLPLHSGQAHSPQEPAPPERRRSPYFASNAGRNAEPQVVLGGPRPPSRTPSASTVSFPKLPPLGHTPPLARGHTPPVPNNAYSVPPPLTTGPRRFIKMGSVPRVPVAALETRAERELFSYTEFNDMQSTIFYTAYKTDENMVVSAPTGSGKTTVFELAFLHMFQYKTSSSVPLAIYMAPTKRFYDWRERFKPLDVKCIELTGDTDIADVHKYTAGADLIITTPEKWDSITRRRSHGEPIQSRLCLMMIDEIHTLHEERGATLEVVVSRMKKRGDALRFVAVPNIDDVARWIGGKGTSKPEDIDDDDEPMPAVEYEDIELMPKARVFKFGSEYRPVPLKLHAIGVDSPNEFALSGRLDKELWRVLNQHTDGLPTVVFCPTRKACQATAEHIFKEYQSALTNRTRLPWDPRENKRVTLKDAKIQKWTELGIAVHHAGLELLDRRTLEQAFRNSELHLLVATSTLAVGVNLPAHLVVIKGTSCWAGQGFREYSDIDIQQMMGRAGRPQYDTSGTVVIMCNNNRLHKYQSMMHSKTILESCLHQHLTEHINSEIGLGTIGSLENAQEWLRGTFLSIRIRQNPKHYQETMTKDHSKSWDEALDHFVATSVGDLKKHDFITDDPEIIKESDDPSKQLVPTRLGNVMSTNFISYRTMCHIVSMDADSSLRDLLELLAGSTEFSRLRIRQGEGALLNKLRIHEDIRYQIDQAKTYADKIFILLQVCFGNISLDEFSASAKTENASPLQTLVLIFKDAQRIVRAIFNVACHKKYGQATMAALELCRTVYGKAWEDSPTVFRQIDKIGPKSITVLKSNGINSFDDLIKLDPSRIEMWLNRHPPFGYEVLERANAFPRFIIEFTKTGLSQDENGFPLVKLSLQIKNTGQLMSNSVRGGRGFQNRKSKGYSLVLLTVSAKDHRFIDCRNIYTSRLNDGVRQFSLQATLYDPDEKLMCVAGVTEKSGLSRTYMYDPQIPADKFPKREEIITRINGDEAESPRRGSARSRTPPFLPADFEGITELSDGDDEVIDLTISRSHEGKKRPRGVASKPPKPKPKKRTLALAVKSFIDDEAIDDDEDAEDEDPDDDDGFIDMGDRPPPSKSARSKGKAAARGATVKQVDAGVPREVADAVRAPKPPTPSDAVRVSAPDPVKSAEEQFNEWFGQFM